MTLDRIKQFQSQLAALCKELAALQNLSPFLTDRELAEIARTKKITDTSSQPILNLPLDEQLWKAVNARVLETVIWWLTGLYDGFKDMARSVRDRSQKHESAAQAIADFSRHALSTKEHLLSAIETLNGGVQFSESPVPLSPGRMLAILKIKIFPDFIESPYPELAYEEGELLLYHPLYTPELMAALSISLRQGVNKIQLSCTQTPSFFEMVLTIQDLHLRPDLWPVILNGIPLLYLDTLYEMGGQIMPLTWTEDRGEGAVVRLPWAKTS